jgi:hypothetical protein
MPELQERGSPLALVIAIAMTALPMLIQYLGLWK